MLTDDVEIGAVELGAEAVPDHRVVVDDRYTRGPTLRRRGMA